MVQVNVFGDNDKLFEQIRKALTGKLSTRQVKTLVEREAAKEIEKAVDETQDLFRPDRGPGGGDDLIALLGIGEGGRVLTEKFAGRDAAFNLLKPGTAATNFSSVFRRRSRGRFGLVNYEINLERFYNNFRSTYISRKRGDSDFEISWMDHLINGIPTTQLREYPEGENEFVLVTGGQNFNENFSRTGLGHMVPAGRLRIPARQFVFNGRGEAATFDVLFAAVTRRLSSSRFRTKIEKAIARIIGG